MSVALRPLTVKMLLLAAGVLLGLLAVVLLLPDAQAAHASIVDAGKATGSLTKHMAAHKLQARGVLWH